MSRKPTMCVFRFENNPTILVSHAMTSPFGQQTKQRNHPFPIRHASAHSLYVLLSAPRIYSYIVIQDLTRPFTTRTVHGSKSCLNQLILWNLFLLAVIFPVLPSGSPCISWPHSSEVLEQLVQQLVRRVGEAQGLVWFVALPNKNELGQGNNVRNNPKKHWRRILPQYFWMREWGWQPAW